MQRSDIRAVGDLAGEASSVLTALVRGMHAGISGRVFDSIGPSATPTRTIHDGLTRAIPLVYAKLHDWLAHSPERLAGGGDTSSDVCGDG
jgi:hypothetical protein